MELLSLCASLYPKPLCALLSALGPCTLHVDVSEPHWLSQATAQRCSRSRAPSRWTPLPPQPVSLRLSLTPSQRRVRGETGVRHQTVTRQEWLRAGAGN
ncbi:hypothetical protein EYF80_027562 [Liparis tanakae]|uniref:Uncharacterized protein n=1 Tax=Liparis tanakae TaxID=230148 RepID=A0A4Z2HBM4_9TELE|nr:hypothetical protein EYF80_027562 [Liparis tanakae]